MYEILFQYGALTVKTINLLVAAGFVAGALVALRFIQLKKMNAGFLSVSLTPLLIASLTGGRLFHVAEHFPLFGQNPLHAFFVWDMGFSPFGIFYAALLTIFWLSRKAHEDFWAWADALVIGGLAGLFFVHIGHFFNGSFYGKVTNLPWGISFDTITIPVTTPIHPTQLYSALAVFIIFSYTVKSVKRTHLTGVAGTLAIMLYSLSAFGIDFLHGEPSYYFRASHLTIAAAAFIAYIHCSHKKLFAPSPN